jgi:hypothetical protein
VFTKNRERLMAGEVAQKFFQKVRQQAERAGLLDDEHFSVDGSLIEAWASRDSYVEKKDPPQRGTGARGRKLLRDTHESQTDLQEASRRAVRLSYLGHIVTEHKHGLIVESCLTQASKRAEWEAALAMLGNMASGGREITVAADRGYQEEKFIAAVRALGVVPLVAEYKPSKYWKNWLTREEREHPRFALSQKKRRLIEKVFSWIKNIAGLRRTKFRGRRRVEWAFRIAATAHNLVRMRKLIPAV